MYIYIYIYYNNKKNNIENDDSMSRYTYMYMYMYVRYCMLFKKQYYNKPLINLDCMVIMEKYQIKGLTVRAEPHNDRTLG